MKTLALGAETLSLDDFRAVTREGALVTLHASARAKVDRCHRYLLDRISRSNELVYAVNTGFGKFSDVRISPEDIGELQVNILRSHACGVGAPLDSESVRGMLLLRAVSLAQGHSGVSVETVQRILDLLNARIHPRVPTQGSVGASGDLAPLSHLALVLIGEGEAELNGKLLSGGEALKKADLQPLRLGPKEGLALINGTQFMTSVGAHLLLSARSLLDQANRACAMSLEALRGSASPFFEGIHRVRPHFGQGEVARRMVALLNPDRPSEIAKSHEGCDRVQDAYSLRCVPQVHGACQDAIAFVQRTLEVEMNSVTDNPLVFPEEDRIVSGGNFHGEPVAMALDFLGIALSELASISLERINKLMNPEFSKLPPFLVKKGGLHSGLMMLQTSAAALVSENKTLAHPAVVDSIPNQNDKEDHVSMGAWAAMKARKIESNVRRVIAMELISAAQGLEFLRPLKSTSEVEKIYSWVRAMSAPYDSDRSLSIEIENLAQALA